MGWQYRISRGKKYKKFPKGISVISVLLYESEKVRGARHVVKSCPPQWCPCTSMNAGSRRKGSNGRPRIRLIRQKIPHNRSKLK